MARATRAAKSGRFRPNPETAKQDARACELFAKGWTYQQIADDIGWKDAATAYRSIERAYKATVSPSVEMARERSLDRLNHAHTVAREILDKTHIAISQGRVMRHPETDAVLTDDGPRLSAIDRIVKIEQRIATCLGFDSPTKSSVEVITKDLIADRMEQLTRELEMNDPVDEDADSEDVDA